MNSSRQNDFQFPPREGLKTVKASRTAMGDAFESLSDSERLSNQRVFLYECDSDSERRSKLNQRSWSR